jgi:hypothetical protein
VQPDVSGCEHSTQLHTVTVTGCVLGCKPLGSWRGFNSFGPAPFPLRFDQVEPGRMGSEGPVATFPKNEPYCTDSTGLAVEFLDVTRSFSILASLSKQSVQQPIHAARSSKVPPGNRRMFWQGDSKCVSPVCFC